MILSSIPIKDKTYLKNIWGMIMPYWKSEEKWIARLLLFVIIVLTLGRVFLQVLFNQWYNEFYDALQNLDKHAFVNSILYFSFLAVIYIVVAVYSIYLTQMLTIHWRRWLTTHFLNHWLSEQNYYHMQIAGQVTDNPDQRISEDISQFISLTLGLSLGLLSAVVTLLFFAAILWRLSGSLDFHIHGFAVHIPGYMLLAVLGYSIIGTWLINRIGRPLVKLNFNQQRFEADFRFGMARFRENSENIAFYQGEAEEKQRFFHRFSLVFSNYWQIMKRQKSLTWFTTFYAQAALIFPFLVSCPRLFAKKIQLGDVMQIVNTFGHVSDSLSYIINSYEDIASWKATSDRLAAFTIDMEKAEKHRGFRRIFADVSQIEVRNLTIKLPDGKILQQGINLCLKQDDSLLITGPSGSGKTTLFRILSGLWLFADGKVILPKHIKILFIPQRPYLPLGTLKQILCYPSMSDAFSDQEIQETLQLCQLGHLCGMISQEADWSKILSVGEQQRISFARTLLSKPEFLFLDEATSALDEASEGYLYQLLKEQCPHTCIVSIGHRSSLKHWHAQELGIFH